MGFTMRAALCVAGLAGAAHGCLFPPCGAGCTSEYFERDVSESIMVECTATERQPVSLSFPTSCHTGVEPAVSTTTDVCEVELSGPTGAAAVCKKAGTCRVFRKMGLTDRVCRCAQTPTTPSPSSWSTTTNTDVPRPPPATTTEGTTTTTEGTTTTWPTPVPPSMTTAAPTTRVPTPGQTDAPCELLAMPTGTVDFPEGVGAYQPNTRRCWVGTCAKKMLLVTFWQLDLESCCDRLDLEWESRSGELFKRTVTGSGRRDFVFEGQHGDWNGSGELRMDFSSDLSVQGQGFVVEWHCTDDALPTTTEGTTTTTEGTTTTWPTPVPPTPVPMPSATAEPFTCRDWGAHNCGTYQMKPFAGHIVCGETWRDCTQPLCCRAATTTAAPAFTCADWGAASCKSGVLRAHASRITCGATPSGCFESLCCAARAQAAPGGQATCGGWASRGGSCYPRRLRADADDVVCGADDFACTDAQCCTA